MKVWCTILRKNGTYITKAVKAGQKTFVCDGGKYEVTGFYHGRFLGIIPALRAPYIEGYPKMLNINWDDYKKDNKIKLKIDARGLKDLTDKKILGVFSDMTLSRLEQLIVLIAFATIGVGLLNLVIVFQLVEKLGGL